MRRVLIVDNYDSFTWNLAHGIASVTGVMPTVVRNNELLWPQIDAAKFDGIVISPGPGHPAVGRDFGVSADVIRFASVPVLGVCLGMQGMALAFGGSVVRAEPMHGMVSGILHDGSDALFRGLPTQFNAVRYHSLAVARPFPTELLETAWTVDGVPMALRHRTRPLWGVQFHPESILSEYGIAILRNFLRL